MSYSFTTRNVITFQILQVSYYARTLGATKPSELNMHPAEPVHQAAAVPYPRWTWRRKSRAWQRVGVFLRTSAREPEQTGKKLPPILSQALRRSAVLYAGFENGYRCVG